MPLPRRPLTLLLATFALLTVPLAAQSISGERPASSVQFGAADHAQTAPSVATDGELFLVTWVNGYNGSGEIYAARVSRDGSPLDETAIPIAIPPRYGANPQVAWTGRVFLVIWSSYGQIRATKITRDGEIVGERVIGTGWNSSVSCSLARCLVAWTSFADFRYRIEASMLDPEGDTVGETLLIASVDSFDTQITETHIATNGSNFLATWQQFNPNIADREQLYTSVVSFDGAATDPRRIAVSAYALHQHDVASDGSSYFVIWALADGPENRFQGQKLDASGRTSGSVKTFYPGSVGGSVRLTGTTMGFVAVMSRRDLRGDRGFASFRMTDDGTLLDSQPVTITDVSSYSYAFAITGNGSNAFIVWMRGFESPTYPDIYGTLVDGATGDPRPSVLISRSAASQTSPALATDGQSVMTVWSEAVQTAWQIKAARMTPNGETAQTRTVHPSAESQVQPVIAFNGTDYLVSWQQFPNIFVKRLDKFGLPVGNDAALLTSAACAFVAPVIASDGRDFVVAWSECGSEGSRQLVAARIIGGTRVERHVVAQGLNDLYLYAGAIAWNGQQYLLTWLERKPAPYYCDLIACYLSQVQASRLTRAADLIDSRPLLLSSDDGRPRQLPRVVWDGSRFVVLWSDDEAIHAAQVSQSGDVTLPIGAAITADFAYDLAATRDGSSIVVVWTNRVQPYEGFPWTTDVSMARIRLDASLPAATFHLANSVDDELSPALVSVTPGVLVAAYQRVAHERELGSANRVFLRVVQSHPLRRAVQR